MVVLCAAFGKGIIGLFSKEGEVYSIAAYGLKYYMWMFAFMGVNIFASGLFTALNNGRISALIALTRTFILLAPFIVLMPMIFGEAGIYLATTLSEGIAIILSVAMFIAYRKRYHLFGHTELSEKGVN